MEVQKGMKIKASHPYCYRPDGCEFASVTSTWTDKKGREQVGVIYDNGVRDFVPVDGFWEYYEEAS